jgi:peroxiredoxin
MIETVGPAPAWDIVGWLNVDRSLDLASLRGRVVVAAAFQMLCPGCVAQTIPQLWQVRDLFSEDEVTVVGLHTVFEHHEVMTPAALAAFLHEYGMTFPVGVDRPGVAGDPIRSTTRRYGMQGMPTLILIDRQGRLRRQSFGHIPDLRLGAEIMALVREGEVLPDQRCPEQMASRCTEEACAIA